MDQEVVLVIAFVRHLELTEGDIAYSRVEKAVRKVGVFKALHCNAGVLIKLLGDPAGNAVQLNSIELRACHRLRYKPHEIAYAAGRLQHIAGPEVHILKCAVDRLDNDRRRIKRRQRGLSGRSVFIFCQKLLQFLIMGIVLFEII